jgi:5-methylcytosine-specific restriction endonuclease McrA
LRSAISSRDGSAFKNLGRPIRTIPAALRRELETRYPVCGVKGCDNDQFLEIDHVVPISEGGTTDISNLWRICTHHLWLKTYEGWKVIVVEGAWDLVPP